MKHPIFEMDLGTKNRILILHDFINYSKTYLSKEKEEEVHP